MRVRSFALLIGMVLLASSMVPVAAAAGCTYTLGFRALADQVPDTVGACAADPAPQPNGDVQQATENGLLVWRKADNWTAFTDGELTWVNGPCGLESRRNTATLRFEMKLECEPAHRDPSVAWGRMFGSYFTHGTYFDVYNGPPRAYGVMAVRSDGAYHRIEFSFTEFSVDAANAAVTYTESPEFLPLGPIYLYLSRADVLTISPAGPDEGFQMCGPDADWQATGCAGA